MIFFNHEVVSVGVSMGDAKHALPLYLSLQLVRTFVSNLIHVLRDVLRLKSLNLKWCNVIKCQTIHFCENSHFKKYNAHLESFR